MLRSFVVCTFLIPSLALSADGEISGGRLGHILQLQPESHILSASDEDFAVFRSFSDKNPISPTFGTELCIVEALNRNSSLKVKETRVDGDTEEIYEKSVPTGAIAGMTGGFFGVSNKGNSVPLGLVKVEGKVKNRMHPWNSGGIVETNRTSVNILPIKKFQDSNFIVNALQSKPLLIESGKDGIRSKTFDRFDRSAVATTSDGQIIFIVLFEPGGRAASLDEFSHLLLRFKTSKGGSIKWALAMDGGPGAHLYVPKMKKHCGAPTFNYVPNLLYLEK